LRAQKATPATLQAAAPHTSRACFPGTRPFDRAAFTHAAYPRFSADPCLSAVVATIRKENADERAQRRAADIVQWQEKAAAKVACSCGAFVVLLDTFCIWFFVPNKRS
jgi:hypothetical protein